MFINIIMISVIIRFERACLWKDVFPEQNVCRKREDTYKEKQDGDVKRYTDKNEGDEEGFSDDCGILS